MHTYIELSQYNSLNMHFFNHSQTLNLHYKSPNTLFLYIWYKMLSSSPDTLPKLSKTISPQNYLLGLVEGTLW